MKMCYSFWYCNYKLIDNICIYIHPNRVAHFNLHAYHWPLNLTIYSDPTYRILMASLYFFCFRSSSCPSWIYLYWWVVSGCIVVSSTLILILALTGVLVLWIFFKIFSIISKWRCVILFSIITVSLSIISVYTSIMIEWLISIFSHIIGLLIPLVIVIPYIGSWWHHLTFVDRSSICPASIYLYW